MPFLMKVSGRIVQLDSEVLSIESRNKKIQAFCVDPNAEVTTEAFQPVDLLSLKNGQSIDVSYRVEQDGCQVAKIIHVLAEAAAKESSPKGHS